jgi:hypothetical protein
MSITTYLVFGDLHGRILPAFRLALAWQREHGVRLAGILQVGDLGFFPDSTRLDKATRRHAERDPLELGARDVAQRSREADAVFADPDIPEAMWFIAGNHEDHALLESLQHGAGATPDDFPVDYYARVRCIRDGRIVTLADGLRVGGLWGIDDQAPHARRTTPPRGKIKPRSALELSYECFDVLLTHESPRDAMIAGAGSEDINLIVSCTRPSFAFFGHYHGRGRLDECDFAPTRVFHLGGFEMRGPGGTTEPGSVGVLRWRDGRGSFDYLSPDWLRTFTRHNWRHR